MPDGISVPAELIDENITILGGKVMWIQVASGRFTIAFHRKPEFIMPSVYHNALIFCPVQTFGWLRFLILDFV